MEKALENLSRMEYPGRVIIIGQDPSGEQSVVIYVLTGRSPSSQARKLEWKQDVVYTRPTEIDVVRRGNVDLLIYPSILLFRGGIAVSNGQQTSDIKDYFKRSQNPAEILNSALGKWNYEPDAPIYTPRISGCVAPGAEAALSIIKRAKDGSSEREVFQLSMTPGTGHMICTYNGENKDPLFPFAGKPLDLKIEENSARDMAEAAYKALEPADKEKDFRVAVACVFSKDLILNEYDIQIINRNK
jgi:IMP cyclohydrolase